MADAEERQTAGTYVAVTAGSETFCLHVREIREIVCGASVTSVPGSPRGVAGVINVRGRVMALVDLRGVLEGDATHAGAVTALVVDGDVAEDVAVRVDDVIDVLHLTDQELQEPPAFGLGAAAAYATAVAELDRGLAVVLSLEGLLGAVSGPRLAATGAQPRA